MFRSLFRNAALLAGLGLCSGCCNMPIGNGQLWNRMTSRGSCSESCPTCECPCSGTCGYGGPIDAPAVLTSGGPSLPVQMGPAISTDMPNLVSPRLDPQPQPSTAPAQPMPADPLSRVKNR